MEHKVVEFKIVKLITKIARYLTAKKLYRIATLSMQIDRMIKGKVLHVCCVCLHPRV